ncbi:MAG TPA: type IV pilus twitching motility protein PilT [bacterium]|nr:type IV pilus twitching motility protein PilT [bacterium]
MSDYQIEELLECAINKGASDLHISVGHPPILRVNRALTPIGEENLSPTDTEFLAFSLMTERQREMLKERKEIDFSYNFQDRVRFRVNVFFQKGTISAALRLVPSRIKTIEELNLPPALHKFTKVKQGFVLVTGPSSHGKSTTLAALIDEINRTRAEHIITIEDPIEYLFKEKKAIIEQREVYQDTDSFANALRSTFRQDPDIIMVGEMRDLETIETAITAAETGHLVFATLHTNSAAQTIHRIVDSFPSNKQAQIRAQLSGSLSGVISQRLIPGTKGKLVPACEIMINTPAIANLIRENKIHEIPLVIETSGGKGMISLNRALAELVKTGRVSFEKALSYSLNPAELRQLVGGL